MMRSPKSEEGPVRRIWEGIKTRMTMSRGTMPQFLAVAVVVSDRDGRGRVIPGIDPFMTFREFKKFLSSLYFGGRAAACDLELRDFHGRVISQDDSEVLSKYLKHGDFLILERKTEDASAFFVAGENFQDSHFRTADFVDARGTIQATSHPPFGGNPFVAADYADDSEKMFGWKSADDYEKMDGWKSSPGGDMNFNLLQDTTGTTTFDPIVMHQDEASTPLTRFGTVIARGTCSQYDASDVSVGSSACTSVCLAAAKYLLVDVASEDPSSLSASILDEITRCGVELYRSASTHSSIDDLWSLPQYQTICAALHRDRDLPPHQQLANKAGFEAVMESCLSQLGLHEEAAASSHPFPSRVAIILTKPPETILLLHVHDSQGWYMMDSHGEAQSDFPKVTYLMCFDSMSSLASALVAKFPTLPDLCGDIPYNRFEATPLVAAATVQQELSQPQSGNNQPHDISAFFAGGAPQYGRTPRMNGKQMLASLEHARSKKQITFEKPPNVFQGSGEKQSGDSLKQPPCDAGKALKSVEKGSLGNGDTRQDRGGKKQPSSSFREVSSDDTRREKAASIQQTGSAQGEEDSSLHLSSIMDMTMFVDPVFGQVMADPVVCSDGKTYDRPVIEEHFRRRIEAEEERVRQQEEGARTSREGQNRNNGNDASCCGARPAIKLTSPTTNEEVDGDLTPNEMVERLIVQLMETNAFRLDQEEVADWKRRREEKKGRDRQRREMERRDREEEERMRRAAEAAEANRESEEDERTKACDLVRVVRRIDQGNNRQLSSDDIGLAVHLCDESSERVSVQYAQALTGQVRCMVASCARRLTSSSSASLRWCARCGRLVCRSCLAFEVSMYQSLGEEERLYRICGECVMHLVDVIDPQGACGQLRAFLVRVPLARYTSELSREAVELQDRVAKQAAEQEFGPGTLQLQDQITELEEAHKEVDRDIAAAEARAEAARRDDGKGPDPGNSTGGSTRIEEMEAEIEELTIELQTLMAEEVDTNDDEEVIAHVQAREELSLKLDSLQLALAEEQSRVAFEASPPTHADASVEELEEKYRDLEAQYIRLEAAELPADEDEQMALIQKRSVLETELEELSTRLAMAHSQPDAHKSKAVPEERVVLVCLHRLKKKLSSRWISSLFGSSRAKADRKELADHINQLIEVETLYQESKSGDSQREVFLATLLSGLERLSQHIKRFSQEEQRLYQSAIVETTARAGRDRTTTTDAESLREEYKTLTDSIQHLEGQEFEAALSRLSEVEASLENEERVGSAERAATQSLNAEDELVGSAERTAAQSLNAEDGLVDKDRIDAIGNWDDLRPLPLGLVYPTQRMTNEVELLKNTLSQQLPQSQRKYEHEHADRRRALTMARDALEDEVDKRRAEARNATTSAQEEQRKLNARRARHAQEERERQERERQRLEAERRAREEAENLRRKHQADEEATRQAFAATAGREGAAATFGGTGDLRMCKRCKAGPVENMACSDLAAHNDNSTTYKGSTVIRTKRPNACPNCGWYDAHWHNWPIWDNIYGPH